MYTYTYVYIDILYITSSWSTDVLLERDWFYILATVLCPLNAILSWRMLFCLTGCYSVEDTQKWNLYVRSSILSLLKTLHTIFSRGWTRQYSTQHEWEFLFHHMTANTDCSPSLWYVPLSLVWDDLSLLSWLGFLYNEWWWTFFIYLFITCWSSSEVPVHLISPFIYGVWGHFVANLREDFIYILVIKSFSSMLNTNIC